MTKLPADHPFRRHAANLASVKKGLVQLERLHRAAIRAGDQAATETVSRFHMFAVGLLAEAQLRTIIWDPTGFNERERNLLRNASSQLERWTAAVEYAFRRHYSVPLHRELDQFILGAVPFRQFEVVTSMMESHLSVVIDDRNKTAHAQWVWHLNNRQTAVVGPAPKPLNYRAIKVRSDLILHVANLVHVLVVSESTFQRDFDAISKEIRRLAPLVDGGDYDLFVQELRRSSANVRARLGGAIRKP